MPTTRRSSGGRGRPASGNQSTLSFNQRVTKSVPKTTKNTLANAKSSTTPMKPSPLSKTVVISAAEDPAVPNEAELEQAEEEAKIQQPESEPEAEEKKKSDAELRADQVSDRQIDQYWRKLERERVAKRVHQEDLSLAEKVLRYWDVSSQYGPCVGMTRMKRWQRAEKLGLSPPVEVLAVLLKEEEKGTKSFEKAHMDEILNSTAVGAG